MSANLFVFLITFLQNLLFLCISIFIEMLMNLLQDTMNEPKNEERNFSFNYNCGLHQQFRHTWFDWLLNERTMENNLQLVNQTPFLIYCSLDSRSRQNSSRQPHNPTPPHSMPHKPNGHTLINTEEGNLKMNTKHRNEPSFHLPQLDSFPWWTGNMKRWNFRVSFYCFSSVSID